MILGFCSDGENFFHRCDGEKVHQITPPCFGFDMGSIVGVHLNMSTGTLGFSLNREFLGIAFKIKDMFNDRHLFPIVKTDASCCVLKLIFSGEKCPSIPRLLSTNVSTDVSTNERKFSWFLFFHNERNILPSKKLFNDFAIEFLTNTPQEEWNSKLEKSNFGRLLVEFEEIYNAEVEDVTFKAWVKNQRFFWNVIKNLWKNNSNFFRKRFLKDCEEKQPNWNFNHLFKAENLISCDF